MSSARHLGHLTIEDLCQEVERRERAVAALERRRSALERRLAAIDAKIAASGGSTGSNGAHRRRRQCTLADALAKVLRGKRLTVAEAMSAVRRTGYHSNSPNFRTMVNIQLLDKKRFKRVERGTYTAL